MRGGSLEARASDKNALLRIGLRSLSAGIAALATGFAVEAGWWHGSAPAEPTGGPGGVTVIAKTPAVAAAAIGQIAARPNVRLASLDADDTDVALAASGERQPAPPSRGLGVSFDQRFSLASFSERFVGETNAAATAISDAIAEPPKSARNERLALADMRDDAESSAVRSQSAAKHAAISLPEATKDSVGTKDATSPKDAVPDADNRTAIYDIAAHTVYLPDGRRLEAHSGRGSHLDDPRAVNIKGKGPTPPNVYELSLRENRFHGVRALRLTPIGDGKMFGRDGILAHTYMLGRNGQSMGCVSFSDYPAFLNAYLKGEVNRLVVVEHLANTPDPKTASRGTFENLKSLFTRS